MRVTPNYVIAGDQITCALAIEGSNSLFESVSAMTAHMAQTLSQEGYKLVGPINDTALTYLNVSGALIVTVMPQGDKSDISDVGKDISYAAYGAGFVGNGGFLHIGEGPPNVQSIYWVSRVPDDTINPQGIQPADVYSSNYTNAAQAAKDQEEKDKANLFLGLGTGTILAIIGLVIAAKAFKVF